MRVSAVPVTALTFTPDGSALLSNGDRRVEVRSPRDGAVQRNIECDLPKITSLAFSSNGHLLAAGGGEPGVSGTVLLFTWPEGKLLHRVSGPGDLVASAAFDAGGTLLAAASADSTARLWRLTEDKAPEPLRTLTGHSGPVLAIAFSPSGNSIATASADRSLKIWSATDGKLLRTLGQHTEAIHAMAFRPAGRVEAGTPVTCATAGDDRTVRIWQPETGRMVRIVRQHEGPVLALAWSGDGSALFSAGKEGIIRRIDGSSDVIQSSWHAHNDWIYAIAVSPDGSVLASADWSGAVKIQATGAAASAPTAELKRLPYNNPGLVVDLGVGLWAWPVPCDADSDGDFDLVVSCPDKPSNGVWLFENATGDTAKNKLPVFKPARKLSGTVHYVMPSWVEGKLRVLSPGYEYPHFEKSGLTEKVKLPVNAGFYTPQGTARGGPRVRHNQWRYADYDGDGRRDLIVGIEDWSFYGWDNAWNERGEWTNGPLHGFVHVFRNAGTTEAPQYSEPFQVQADGKPVDTFGCPSPNFVNFDDDDDLDLLCGEFLDGFTYYENIGTSSEPRYAAGRRVKDVGGREVRMDLEMIVPVAFDWDRDGDFDLIVGDEDGRVAFVENTGSFAERVPVFTQPVYFQQEADTLKCGALATPFGVDWDGDGDTDIVSGNTAGYIEFFEDLSGPKDAQPKWAAPRRLEVDGKPFRIMAGPNGSIQGPAEAKWGYTTLNVADWDGDGLPDILLNSILGEVVWLRNSGTRSEPKLAAPQPVEVEWNGPQPSLAWGWRRPQSSGILTQWRTTPVVHDFNKDGLPDLAMLDQEGYLAFFERWKVGGKLLLKSPRRAFVDEKGQPLRLNVKIAGGSGRRKLCVTDWDGDGKFDFLLNSANADFLQQVGEKDGAWIFRNAGSLAKKDIEGHDVSPAVVDFDGDGVPDFLGGAEDGRFYFLKNPRTTP